MSPVRHHTGSAPERELRGRILASDPYEIDPDNAAYAYWRAAHCRRSLGGASGIGVHDETQRFRNRRITALNVRP
jgi:hypothetical protein